MSGFGVIIHHFHDDKKHIPIQGSMTADEFEKLLGYCSKKFNLFSAQDWLSRAVAGTLSDKDVCLTFDDSLRCQFDIALPVLRKFKLKAFWFIYTSPLDGVVEKIELYRYFRNKHFRDIQDFYAAFDKVIETSAHADLVRKGLKAFSEDQYLTGFTFYSLEDKKFRFIRDEILGKEKYDALMDEMIKNYGLDRKDILSLLWMDQNCIETLDKEGHIIGLHSHTHPMNLGALSAQEQKQEYTTNFQKLKSIVRQNIMTMSHPSNSYNKDTFAVLKDLNINIGFRANMAMPEHSVYEFARYDHSLLVKEMQLESNCIHK